LLATLVIAYALPFLRPLSYPRVEELPEVS
jgi:hypothetical protein